MAKIEFRETFYPFLEIRELCQDPPPLPAPVHKQMACW